LKAAQTAWEVLASSVSFRIVMMGIMRGIRVSARRSSTHHHRHHRHYYHHLN
jgi:hypothetical protein